MLSTCTYSIHTVPHWYTTLDAVGDQLRPTRVRAQRPKCVTHNAGLCTAVQAARQMAGTLCWRRHRHTTQRWGRQDARKYRIV